MDRYTYKIKSAKNIDRYTQTTREISRYASTNYKHSSDIKRTVEDKTVFTIPVPTKPSDPGISSSPAERLTYKFEGSVYKEEVK